MAKIKRPEGMCRLALFTFFLSVMAFQSEAGWMKQAPARVQEEEEGEKAPPVGEIVEKTNRVAYYQGEDGSAKVYMTIKDSQGRERHSQFTILRRDEKGPEGSEADMHCGGQKFYLYFHIPADVNKMVFMVWKHLDKDDDRWLYLPGLDLVKRIASTDKRTSFVGSHFFYEDVSGRNINADIHELVKTSKTIFLLKNTPKDPESVEFSHYNTWIHRETFIPTQVDYYDKNGEKYREYKALKVEPLQGYLTVTKAVMKDLRAKEETIIEYNNVKYNIGLPEDIFTERYLRRAPVKYLK